MQESQCDRPIQRTIATQTLAKQVRKSRNSRNKTKSTIVTLLAAPVTPLSAPVTPVTPHSPKIISVTPSDSTQEDQSSSDSGDDEKSYSDDDFICPELDNKPAGNILIPAATIITGGTYESTKQFANALNLSFVNKDQFYQVQDDIIFPVIEDAYKKQQKDVIETMKKEKKPVDLCGDGRSDSPGHNAKYGTYSLMDETSEKIVDFSLVQVSEVSSSNAVHEY